MNEVATKKQQAVKIHNVNSAQMHAFVAHLDMVQRRHVWRHVESRVTSRLIRSDTTTRHTWLRHSRSRSIVSEKLKMLKRI